MPAYGRKKIVSHNARDEFFISHNIRMSSKYISVSFEFRVLRRPGDNTADDLVGACGRKKIVSHNVRDEFFISHNIRMSSKSIYVGFELGVSRRRGYNMSGALVGAS